MRKLQTRAKVESEISLEQELPLRDKIKDAKSRWESSYLTLAKYLHEIHRNRSWEEWGYASLSDYCEQELDFHYRRAMFMIDIYGHAVLFNIPLERLGKIGWAKARELVRVIMIGTVEEWLTIAENSTLKELMDKIKLAKKADPENMRPVDEEKKERLPLDKDEAHEVKKTKSSSMIFRTEGFEYEIISRVLDEAKGQFQTTNPTFALSMICLEWEKQREDSGISEAVSLKEWIAFLNDKFGVRLIKTGQIKKEESIEEEEEADILDDEEDLGDLSELD